MNSAAIVYGFRDALSSIRSISSSAQGALKPVVFGME
jgi:hypothetical protein